jgi:hypothetical protein
MRDERDRTRPIFREPRTFSNVPSCCPSLVAQDKTCRHRTFAGIYLRPWNSENNKPGTIPDRGTEHDLESKASDSCRTRESLRSRHFHNAAPAELSGAASPDQLPLATARPSDTFPNRRLNAETSANVRKQYLTVFSGRSTYMSHSKSHPSSQSRMSMAAASNEAPPDRDSRY